MVRVYATDDIMAIKAHYIRAKRTLWLAMYKCAIWLLIRWSWVRDPDAPPYFSRTYSHYSAISDQAKSALCQFCVNFVSISYLIVSLSAYPTICSTDKCAYRLTISTLSQPPSSCKTCNGVPAWTCQLAQVCRKSCQRKSLIPTRLSAALQALELVLSD